MAGKRSTVKVVKVSRIVRLLEREATHLKSKALFHPDWYLRTLIDRIKRMK